MLSVPGPVPINLSTYRVPMFRVDVRGSEYMQVDDEDGNGDDNDDDDDISFRLLGYFVAVPGMTNKGKGISPKN